MGALYTFLMGLVLGVVIDRLIVDLAIVNLKKEKEMIRETYLSRMTQLEDQIQEIQTVNKDKRVRLL